MIFDLKFFTRYLYTDRLPLIQLINEKKYNGPAVEIGVARGEFSQMLLDQTNLNVIYSIDSWKNMEYKYEETKIRLKKYNDRSIIMKKTSKKASRRFKKNYFDFIHIDANHSYESVKEDLMIWWPLLKNNGLFSGHDYMKTGAKGEKYGVIEAVDEFSKKTNTKLHLIGSRWKSWYLFKNEKFI